MKSAAFKLGMAVAGATLVAGCAGIRDHRGHVLDKELSAAIAVGTDNKESVVKTLGRPTFAGQFDDKEWFYVSRDTSTIAFRNARVTDQTVLRVRFDDAGNVVAVDRTGKELIASIDPANARTPTLGRKKSFFDDLFGNIGTVGQAFPGSQGQGRQQ